MHNQDGRHGLNFLSKQTYLQLGYLAVEVLQSVSLHHLQLVLQSHQPVLHRFQSVVQCQTLPKRGTSRLSILCLLRQTVFIEIPKFIACIFSVILIFKLP